MLSKSAFFKSVVSTVVAMGLASSAWGAPIAVSVQMGENPPVVWTPVSQGTGEVTVWPEPYEEEKEGDLYSGLRETDYWECDWSVVANENPFVQAFTAVTNTSSSTQVFTVNVTAFVSPMSAPTEIKGSVSGSLTDADGQQVGGGMFARLQDAGVAVYTAEIDGSGVRTLHDSLLVEVDQAFDSVNVPSANFGIPTPEVGPNVLTTIGITLRFELSPGDSASLTSVFDVVPEPATLGLLGLGGLFAFRRRTRTA